MSAETILELAKLLEARPDLAEVIKGMHVVHNTYHGNTTVYIGCSAVENTSVADPAATSAPASVPAAEFIMCYSVQDLGTSQ